MISQKKFFFFGLHILSAFASTKSGCSISIKEDLGNPSPLLVYPQRKFGEKSFYWPNGNGIIHLRKNYSVEVACPMSNLLIKGKPGKEIDYAMCKGNQMVSIKNKSVYFVDITCEMLPKSTAKYTKHNCFEENKFIEIGFFVGDDFLKLMEICFNRIHDTTFYSKFILSKNIGAHQTSVPRPTWTDKFFSTPHADKLYERKSQRKTINKLLGLNDRSTKYIKDTGEYLARGHLIPKADLIYGLHQMATFYLINAAPQWQTFNGKNWKALEETVRKFVSHIRKELTVYTGTYGTATLPHERTGKQTKLYLYVHGSTKKIPVPHLFWKVLFEPNSRAGIAFIGINNPYNKKHSYHDIVCEDICDKIHWLKFDRRNSSRGYIYCCAVDDFRRSVDMLPKFKVQKLLK